jgi:hypothetical protein
VGNPVDDWKAGGMKIATLKKHAKVSATELGHKIRWGKTLPVACIGKCVFCGAWVQVLTHPQPNQIDIGGPAIALNCPKSKSYKGCMQ